MGVLDDQLDESRNHDTQHMREEFWVKKNCSPWLCDAVLCRYKTLNNSNLSVNAFVAHQVINADAGF